MEEDRLDESTLEDLSLDRRPTIDITKETQQHYTFDNINENFVASNVRGD